MKLQVIFKWRRHTIFAVITFVTCNNICFSFPKLSKVKRRELPKGYVEPQKLRKEFKENRITGD